MLKMRTVMIVKHNCFKKSVNYCRSKKVKLLTDFISISVSDGDKVVPSKSPMHIDKTLLNICFQTR